MTDKNGFSTRCVHEGELDDSHGSPHTPIYNTTTFQFNSTKDITEVVEGRRKGSLYTRYGLNPTITSLEEKLASIEYAESSLCFSSGMAAESALFLALGRKGILCIGDAYGGTLELLDKNLRSLGIPVYFLLGKETDKMDKILGKGVELVFFETPTNPALEIFDIKEISKIAHSRGAIVAVDNTFATPVNQNPLLLGADIVVHSATKYLGGHSDITAGAVMGPSELLAVVGEWRKNLGQVLSPEVSSLLSRSIKSLPVRVERQNSTAGIIARAMEKHQKVKRVLYPGLSSFTGHKLASKQMKGFGGMLTLDLDATKEETEKVADSLQLIRIAPSLGGVESICTQPVTTTHYGLSPEELSRRNITSSMIRFSIGLEDPEDLIGDLEQALEKI